MIDTKKRRTLKWLSATPLAAIPLAGMGSISGFPQTASHELTSTAHRQGTLDVQIIDSGRVPENTVLIQNSGSDEIVISQFTGGIVIFNNRMLDLNTLVAEKPLVIAANQTKSCSAQIWSILVAPEEEYVYADHSAEVMDNDAAAVRLGIYMFNDRAVVYAKSPSSMYS